MKRTIKLVALALATVLLALSLFACGKEEEATGTMTLVIGTEPEQAFTVNLDEVKITEGALSVVKHLANQGKITYEIDATGYFNAVGGLKNDAASGTYIYIYTSIKKDFNTSAYASSKVWNGKTLTSSGVGISDMTVSDGAVIYIGTIKW